MVRQLDLIEIDGIEWVGGFVCFARFGLGRFFACRSSSVFGHCETSFD
jgi:hypothetical protein